MHFAPAVRFPVGRSASAARLVVLLWVLGVSGVTAWAWQTQAGPNACLAAYGVCAACGLAAWRGRPGRHRGLLCCEQGQWHWQPEHGPDAPPGAALAVREIAILVDLPRHLLVLRLPTPGGAFWLWVERAHDPGLWPDVRRALRAHPRLPELAARAATGRP